MVKNANKWTERSNQALLSRSWIRPPDQCYKAYFDGSISARNACLGSGVYIEDCGGKFVLGGSRSFLGIHDPHVSEFLALRECLMHILTLGTQPVTIIGDAQEVILEALGENPCPANCIPICEEIQDLIRTIPCLGVFWVWRAFNLVAREFAHHAKNNPASNTSWLSPPDFLVSVSAG